VPAHRIPPIACLIALLATATPALSQDMPTVSPALVKMNERLTQMGSKYRILKAEYVTVRNGKAVGNTIIANDREFQLLSQWVPNDARRNADGRNITYLVDQSDATPNGGLSSVQAEAAIDRAMSTWNAVPCGGGIPIVKRADSGADPDLVDGLFGFGSVGTPNLADIVHAGWMPPAFFEFIFPGFGSSVLGITFSGILLDPASGHDINGDHRYDTSFAEIYYNNYFAWGLDANPPVADVESVALHEAGHGLSQGHFGMIFTASDGSVQFAPFAVMNAVFQEDASFPWLTVFTRSRNAVAAWLRARRAG
jgi:hypothetical protein